MNSIIESYIKDTYGFEIESATPEDLQKVTEILVSDSSMDYSLGDKHKDGEWNFSIFPNLKKRDCSYNPIDLLDISKNHEWSIFGFKELVVTFLTR